MVLYVPKINGGLLKYPSPMKLINSAPEKKHSFAIAKFSKLLGCELVLSNYTGKCQEKATLDGLEAMALVFADQHEELMAVNNAIAGFAIGEAEDSNHSMEEFVSGADFLEKESGFPNQPNMAKALKNAHSTIIGIIEKEILPFVNEKKDNNINSSMKSLLLRHRTMITILDKFV